MNMDDTPSERSLMGILNTFVDDGYRSEFHARVDGSVECGKCRHSLPPERLRLERLERLEGASDPDEMLAVCAVECPECGARGTLVLTYGPETTYEDGQVLTRLKDVRREDTRPRREPPSSGAPIRG
jgi:hypothetical protein